MIIPHKNNALVFLITICKYIAADYFIINSNVFRYNPMQNKQLERQLKQIVQSLRGDEILRVIDIFEKEEGLFLNKNFTKSGINCTCCTLTQDKFVATGFGRNQQEALINATKNYLETLIATNTLIVQLRTALRQKETKKQTQQPLSSRQNDTIQLDDVQNLSEIKETGQQKLGCKCIYYEVHKHHMAEIKNMQARMKLIIKQNEMLKHLLFKQAKKQSKNHSCADKENLGWKANIN